MPRIDVPMACSLTSRGDATSTNVTGAADALVFDLVVEIQRALIRFC